MIGGTNTTASSPNAIMTEADPTIDFTPNKTFTPQYIEQDPPSFKSLDESWQKRLEELPKDPHYQFPQSILKLVKTPADVFVLLKNGSFISKLTQLQLIQLVAVHPFIATSLFKSYGFVKEKPTFTLPPAVMALGQGNPITAQAIIDEYGIDDTQWLPGFRINLNELASYHEASAKSSVAQHREPVRDRQSLENMSYKDVEALTECDKITAENYYDLYQKDEEKEGRLITLGSNVVSVGLKILAAAVAKGEFRNRTFVMARSRVELAIYFAEHPVLHAKFKRDLHEFADFPCVIAILSKTYGPAIFAQAQGSLEKFNARMALETTIRELAQEWLNHQPFITKPALVINNVESTLQSVTTTEQALALLHDNTFLAQLNTNQLSKLMSLQATEIVAAFLSNNRLNKDDILFSEFKNGNFNTLKFFIDHKEQFADLTPIDLVDMASENEQAAEYLLNHPNFPKTGTALAQLGHNLINIAEKILKNPKWREKLSPADFALLGSKRSAIKDLILDGAQIAFSKVELAKLQVTDLEKANLPAHVVKIYELLSKKELYALGCEFPAVAKYILATPTLCEKLELDDSHSRFEHYTLLGKVPELSRQYAQSDACYEKLGRKDLTPFIALTKNDAQTAEYVWAHPELRSIFLQKDKRRFLVEFAMPHPQITLNILQHLQFNQHLKSDMLVELANTHVSLAWYLVQTPSLRIRVSADDLATLTRYPVVGAYLTQLYGAAIPAEIAQSIQQRAPLYEVAQQAAGMAISQKTAGLRM